MKQKFLIGLLIAAAGLAPSLTNAQGLSIEIGDRPYYRHGPRYFSRGRHYVWVPGHWARHHRIWVHGHYAVIAGGGRRWR
ncbi:MAG: hypothetical protein M3Y69_00410 [Verrucomicrobiota bacterium]|nr:hypothetical protein [Verrucomicrobiota bacterium]